MEDSECILLAASQISLIQNYQYAQVACFEVRYSELPQPLFLLARKQASGVATFTMPPISQGPGQVCAPGCLVFLLQGAAS